MATTRPTMRAVRRRSRRSPPLGRSAARSPGASSVTGGVPNTVAAPAAGVSAPTGGMYSVGASSGSTGSACGRRERIAGHGPRGFGVPCGVARRGGRGERVVGGGGHRLRGVGVGRRSGVVVGALALGAVGAVVTGGVGSHARQDRTPRHTWDGHRYRARRGSRGGRHGGGGPRPCAPSRRARQPGGSRGRGAVRGRGRVAACSGDDTDAGSGGPRAPTPTAGDGRTNGRGSGST